MTLALVLLGLLNAVVGGLHLSKILKGKGDACSWTMFVFNFGVAVFVIGSALYR